MKTPSPLRCPAGAAVAGLLSLACTGCTNVAREPAPGPDGKIAIVEYDNVYIIGSHIPVRVPRSPTATALPTISPVLVLRPDDIRFGSGTAGPPMH